MLKRYAKRNTTWMRTNSSLILNFSMYWKKGFSMLLLSSMELPSSAAWIFRYTTLMWLYMNSLSPMDLL